ncbi:MAG: hypothetical protein EB084_15185 [Proteobacteria bacterium]|nr:hypothetical protein [Pseudomonadota bacterium]
MHPIEEIQLRAERAQALVDAGQIADALDEARGMRAFIEGHPADDVLVQSRLSAVERFIAALEAKQAGDAG